MYLDAHAQQRRRAGVELTELFAGHHNNGLGSPGDQLERDDTTQDQNSLSVRPELVEG